MPNGLGLIDEIFKVSLLQYTNTFLNMTSRSNSNGQSTPPPSNAFWCNKKSKTGELKTARGHMMPPPLHMCNRLTRPADESICWHGTWTTRHSKNIIAFIATAYKSRWATSRYWLFLEISRFLTMGIRWPWHLTRFISTAYRCCAKLVWSSCGCQPAR